MKYTKIYSPVEALLILSEGKVSFPHLFKVTFCEMINNKALTVRIEEDSSYKTDTTAAALIVRSGSQKNSNSHKVHYTALLRPLVNKTNREILFRLYLKIIGQSSLGKSTFVNLILQNESSSKVIKRNILQRIFGGVSLTDEGKDIKRKLEVEVVTMKNQFAIKGQSSSSLMDKLNLYGASVFLMRIEDLSDLNEKLLQYDSKQIAPEYSEQYQEWILNLNVLLSTNWEKVHQYTDASGGSGGDGGCGGNSDLNGDNGCSGCSACSGGGCSGCGGGCS